MEEQRSTILINHDMGRGLGRVGVECAFVPVLKSAQVRGGADTLSGQKLALQRPREVASIADFPERRVVARSRFRSRLWIGWKWEAPPGLTHHAGTRPDPAQPRSARADPA
jgi:hypothetical protein